MLLDRTHRQWALISTAIFAVATVVYVIYVNSTPKGATGGSFVGLMYGIIGTAMMIFAGLLAGRKQVPHWRLGSAQFWLRGHLWLGALSFPFIIYHSGFGLGGLLEQVLWFFFSLVIASGFFGLLMQNFLPRLITTQIPRETFVAQLPYVRKRARLVCDKLVSMDCGRIKLGDDSLKPMLEVLAKHAVEVAEKSAAAKGKEEKDKVKEIKENWAERLEPESRTLFLEMALYAKSEKWITREDDFTGSLHDVYEFTGISLPQATAKKKASSAAAEGPAGLEGLLGEKPNKAQLSLEASRAKRMEGASSHSGDKKISALDMMKLRAAAKKALEGASTDGSSVGSSVVTMAPPKPAAPVKKPSPLEAARAQAAKKAEANASADSAAAAPAAEPEKKLSPLELMKKQAEAKKAAAGGADKPAEAAAPAPAAESSAAPAEPPKKLSPLELARQQATKKAALSGGAPADKPIVTQVEPAPAAPSAPAAEPEKKLSPLELMKQQAAAKKATAATAEKPAGEEAPAAAEQPAAQAAPAEVPAAEPEKKLSPLELMKQQAAAKKAAASGEPAASAPAPAPADAPAAPTGEPEKKLSPLELMKQQSAAKKAAAAGPAPAAEGAAAPAAAPAAEGEKKVSPLELMKQQAAAKKAGAPAAGDPPAAAAPAAAGDKPKSPLELMKEKAAGAKPAAAAAAADKPAAPPKPVAPPKPTAPAPEIVKRVTAPVQVLRTGELHQFYSTMVRPFLNGSGREGRLSDAVTANREFTQMREILPIELHDVIQVLQDRTDEHRQYAELERIHHWLHYWLALHIPFSIALFVLVFTHIVIALRVVPWNF